MVVKAYYILTSILITLVNSLIFPQEVKFERISERQGLSESTVNCALKDSRGFMWFGTDGGLNRYDGYNFVVFKHDASDPNSLSHDLVTSIYEDFSGVLWIGTNGGLNKFDREKEIFRHYRSVSKKPNGLSSDRIKCLYESPNQPGMLWIGTLDGLHKFDIKTETFKRFPYAAHIKSHSNNAVLKIYESQKKPGILWIGTEGGLNKFDFKKNTFLQFKNSFQTPNCLNTNPV